MPDPRLPVTSQLARAGMQVSLLRMKVNSNSMLPFLRKDDSILVTHVKPETLTIGDIVVIHRGGVFITHRLVHINGETFYTKGDHSRYCDPPVIGKDIIGIVVGRIHQDQVSSYQTPQWKRINRVLGKVGYWEADLADHMRNVWLKIKAVAFKR